VYRTLRAIKEGEELCISYGESTRLGFVDVEEEERRKEAERRLRKEERDMLLVGGEESGVVGIGSDGGGAKVKDRGKDEWWKFGGAWDDVEEDERGGWK